MNHGSDYQALAHSWVHNRGSDECYGSRMFSSGNVMYSYGYHYIIAQFVKTKDGQEVVLINTDKYSVTTSKQTSIVIDAIPRCYERFYVSGAMLRHADNISYYMSEIKELLEKATTARSRKQEYLGDVEYLKSQLNRYLELFKPNFRFNKEEKELLKTNASEYDLKLIREARKKRIKTAEAKQRKQRREDIAKEAIKMKKWRAGELNYCYFVYHDTALRVNGDFIETSRSSKVSIKGAKILYDRISKGKEIKGFHVDSFMVYGIEKDSLIIGCHTIPMSEVELIANQLGWTS